MGPVKGPACPMYIIFLPSGSNSELSEPHDIKKKNLQQKEKIIGYTYILLSLVYIAKIYFANIRASASEIE